MPPPMLFHEEPEVKQGIEMGVGKNMPVIKNQRVYSFTSFHTFVLPTLRTSIPSVVMPTLSSKSKCGWNMSSGLMKCGQKTDGNPLEC